MSKKLTKEQFIEKARTIHGERYDYSKVEYINGQTKVCIICPEHGEFWQKPNSHLNGIGCPKCGIESRREKATKTKDQFIQEAREIHGDKYDYSKVEYIGNKIKVCIICPKHGEFWQTPDNHLHGSGCPKCKNEYMSNLYKDTTEIFIEKARKVHGDKYDYSKVHYVDSYTKVCIICPEHGEFWQRPNNHIHGWGCIKCGNKLNSDRSRSTKEKFIKEAKNVHGDKYDYSKIDYQGNKIKIKIICPEHGEFCQTPNNHLHGYGCPICGGTKLKTPQQFIKEAREIHGDKYDYSKVNYVNNKTKVCIICQQHGEFWQTPSDHLQRKGCPRCNESKLEMIVENLLQDKHIIYKPQYQGTDENNEFSRMRIDFYLPEYNIAIECQGEQHFEPINHFGGIDKFISQLKNDQNKLKICKRYGIKMIYFTKSEFITRYNLTDSTEYCFISEPKNLIKKIRDYQSLI